MLKGHSPLVHMRIRYHFMGNLHITLHHKMCAWKQMNDLPVTGYPCYAQRTLGSLGGQTLQVARRKCIAKSCFDDQKNDFGERSTLFRRCVIDNGSGQC